ncbi:MAG: hypothetical protein ACREUU_00490, partial [Gammaproteobacteria bacterium]
MDRIEATLDRLSLKSEEHERWIARHEHMIAALIDTSNRNERAMAQFRQEMRALGRRMDNWLRG